MLPRRHKNSAKAKDGQPAPGGWQEITCALCGGAATRRNGDVNRAHRNGWPIYCSRACSGAARRVAQKRPGWHEARFTPRSTAVAVSCLECARPMWLPASKVEEYKRCSPACNEAHRARARQELERQCETCGGTFRPRPQQIRNGMGRFCSQKCNPSDHLTTPEALAIAQDAKRRRIAEGAIYWRYGPDHHSWKGGAEVSRQRRKQSGKQAAALRAYRALNPDKVREFAATRKGRKLGRLARGTLPKIGKLQRWKCAICAVSIRKAYDVDHIMPLAKGGEHVARNIQLLCRSCNVRKSAKDPMDYMRQQGRLL